MLRFVTVTSVLVMENVAPFGGAGTTMRDRLEALRGDDVPRPRPDFVPDESATDTRVWP